MRIRLSIQSWPALGVLTALPLVLTMVAARYVALTHTSFAEQREVKQKLEDWDARARDFANWTSPDLTLADLRGLIELDRFLKAADRLEKAARQPSALDPDVLVNAVAVKENDLIATKYEAGMRSFSDQLHTALNVHFGVYSAPPPDPKAEPDNETMRRLASFMKAVTGMFASAQEDYVESGGEQSVAYEGVLTRVFFGDNAADRGIIVPWVYLADEDGYQATFPATETHADGEFDPRKRDWWIQAASDGWENPGLTKLYTDYTPQITMAVRTFIKKLRLDGKLYMLCVDVLWLAQPPLPDLASWNLMDRERLWHSMNVFQDPALSGKCLGLCLVLLLVITSTRATRKMYWSLELYKRADFDDPTPCVIKYTNNSRERSSSVFRIGASMKRMFNLFREHTREESDEHSVELIQPHEFSLDIENRAEERGYAIWKLYSCPSMDLRLLGASLSFESRKRRYNVHVKFGTHPNPNFTFHTTSGELIADIAPELKEGVRRYMMTQDRKAHFSLDELQPTRRAEFGDLQESPAVRDMLHRVRDFDEGRLKFYDGLPVVKDLYRDEELRAVIRDYYLQELLNLGDDEVLYTGDLVERIIVFEDDGEWRRFVRANHERLLELDKRHRRQRTKGLRVTNLADIPASLQSFRDKDFAVVGKQCVAVTEDYFLERPVRGSRAEREAVRVHGYLSIRKPDIAFYACFFEILAAKSRPISEYLVSEADPEADSLPNEGEGDVITPAETNRRKSGLPKAQEETPSLED